MQYFVHTNVERKEHMKAKKSMLIGSILVFLLLVLCNVWLKNTNQKQVKREGMVHNVWIITAKDRQLTAWINGKKETVPLSQNVTGLEEVAADLKFQNGIVKKIIVKEEMIKGTLLAMDDKYIEIEQYGKLPLATSFCIYEKKKNGVVPREKNAMVVGEKHLHFVVAAGKVQVVLRTKPIGCKEIRVLLEGAEGTPTWKQVKLTADCSYQVSCGDQEKSYRAGQIFAISQKQMGSKRVSIRCTKADGKIQFLSKKQKGVVPAYRGSFQLAPYKKGIACVNVLSLEEYLYGVIGSEMPISYGLEALKVQAVCARSYACKQILQNQCAAYGAHVDDTSAYQVYNQIGETKETIQAVEETKGQVLTYQDQVIMAYYFSTSCGRTASVEEVWQEKPVPYLVGGSQSTSGDCQSLEQETHFRHFIQDGKYASYDTNYPWFRWTVAMDSSVLQAQIEGKMQALYKENPKAVLCKQKDGAYQKAKLGSLGELKNMQVLERGKSGVIKSLEIVGSTQQWKVIGEYHIRLLLAPMGATIYRKDQSQVNGMTLLPSGFFYVEKKNHTYLFYGGGYGHGVGMSQNGAKAMLDQGYTYTEVLAHYYPDTKIMDMTASKSLQ